MTKEDSKRFSLALAYATKKHANQQRKDGTPYILHPIRVAMHLQRDGYDIRHQIVGLFHDLLEDTEASIEELRQYCDAEMIEAIQLLTREREVSEEIYINAILKNPMAKAVKNADRIDNLMDLENSKNDVFIEKYKIETETYFYKRFSKELDEILIGLKNK